MGAVRVGWLNDKPILNPDRPSMAKSKLDLIVTADGNSDIGENVIMYVNVFEKFLELIKFLSNTYTIRITTRCLADVLTQDLRCSGSLCVK